MSKYDPLTKALERSSRASVPMSFAEVERILGFDLPRSARTHRPWWSNDGRSHTQARSWLSAGYRASEVNLEGEEVVFLREATAESGAPPAMAGQEDDAKSYPSLFGALKGTVRVAPGTDLTEPADPEWGKVYD